MRNVLNTPSKVIWRCKYLKELTDFSAREQSWHQSKRREKCIAHWGGDGQPKNLQYHYNKRNDFMVLVAK